MWIGSKVSKMPYLTIFNKLKHFTMPTFGGTVLLETLNMLLLRSLSTVGQYCQPVYKT